MAMTRKEAPKTQRSACGPNWVVTQLPTAPAKPWLTNVATKMPQTMGQGLRNRAAKTKDKSCVLSPISARATMPVETRKASIASSYLSPQILFWRDFCLLLVRDAQTKSLRTNLNQK
jgi:hypothetical protein